MGQYIEKDPDAEDDVGVDLAGVLPAGVTINDVDVSVAPGSSLVILGDAIEGTLCKARLDAGMLGERNVRVKFTAYLSNGEKKVFSQYVTVVRK